MSKAAVRQMTRVLGERPVPVEVPGVRVRCYRQEEDIESWLELRRRAFARLRVGVRDWDAEDFRREFLSKPWWQPETMWLAETSGAHDGRDAIFTPVGTVTLARRGTAAQGKPVVHWLAVLPGQRHRGIGRLLMATLEAAVWDAGGRQIWLETHAQWQEALRLYEALGYADANE